MPDGDGYLTDNEVLIDGEVWEIRDVGEGYLCERIYDGQECQNAAEVELYWWHNEEESASIILCQSCFEELTREK